MMMIVSDLVYILKMIGPKGTLSDDDDDDNDDDNDDDDDDNDDDNDDDDDDDDNDDCFRLSKHFE